MPCFAALLPFWPSSHPSIVIYWPKTQYSSTAVWSVLGSALHPFFSFVGPPPPAPRDEILKNKEPHACPEQHQMQWCMWYLPGPSNGACLQWLDTASRLAASFWCIACVLCCKLPKASHSTHMIGYRGSCCICHAEFYQWALCLVGPIWAKAGWRGRSHAVWGTWGSRWSED